MTSFVRVPEDSRAAGDSMVTSAGDSPAKARGVEPGIERDLWSTGRQVGNDPGISVSHPTSLHPGKDWTCFTVGTTATCDEAGSGPDGQRERLIERQSEQGPPARRGPEHREKARTR